MFAFVCSETRVTLLPFLQRPTEGERALLAALAAGANAGNILNTLLEHALPRNCQVIENSPLLFFFLSEPFLFLLITM